MAATIEPAAITFYRWLLAGLILSPFLLRTVWRQRAIVAAHWPKLAFLGFLGMGMYQGLACIFHATHGMTWCGSVSVLRLGETFDSRALPGL